MVWVKICGIKTLPDALHCAAAGANAVGFVFSPGKREVSMEQAAAISAALPPGLARVGVFVNRPLAEAKFMESALGLDLVQLHGTESPAYCASFPGRAVKSFRIEKPVDLDAVETYRGTIKACLLDTYCPGRPGGTGRTWDWSLLQGVYAEKLAGIPVIIAGGLNAGNVPGAIEKIRPYGVDVSSGVESGGRKDHDLISAFITTVRRWEDEQFTG